MLVLLFFYCCWWCCVMLKTIGIELDEFWGCTLWRKLLTMSLVWFGCEIIQRRRRTDGLTTLWMWHVATDLSWDTFFPPSLSYSFLLFRFSIFAAASSFCLLRKLTHILSWSATVLLMINIFQLKCLRNWLIWEEKETTPSLAFFLSSRNSILFSYYLNL